MNSNPFELIGDVLVNLDKVTHIKPHGTSTVIVCFDNKAEVGAYGAVAAIATQLENRRRSTSKAVMAGSITPAAGPSFSDGRQG